MPRRQQHAKRPTAPGVTLPSAPTLRLGHQRRRLGRPAPTSSGSRRLHALFGEALYRVKAPEAATSRAHSKAAAPRNRLPILFARSALDCGGLTPLSQRFARRTA
jgi:hypothetical protein